MRSGSVRSYPRQLPPHLEMTLVYCSRDFSTLRSLYPRPYWSLTTGGGAARNSYKCKYICCCVILVLLCLLLSPVLAFLYHLFPFSFVRRSLSSSSVCLFVVVYFVVRALTTPYVSCSGYGLVPVLSVSCSVPFRACCGMGSGTRRRHAGQDVLENEKNKNLKFARNLTKFDEI